MSAAPEAAVVDRPGVAGRLAAAASRNIVPLLFGLLCITGVIAAGIPWPFLVNEVVTRMARNLFLVLSLIIPVVAGMGLNFGIVIGAMCGQAALIITENGDYSGIDALILAVLISIPLSLLFGWLTGLLMNRAKGKEMITGMILAFFANGIYQMIFLLMAGPLIPLRNERILLPTGVGLRNTIDLLGTTVVARVGVDGDHVGAGRSGRGEHDRGTALEATDFDDGAIGWTTHRCGKQRARLSRAHPAFDPADALHDSNEVGTICGVSGMHGGFVGHVQEPLVC
jgi:hypothetical protein